MITFEKEYEVLNKALSENQVSIEMLEAFLVKAEKRAQEKRYKSFNHIIEAYCYAYFVNPEDYEYTTINMGQLYKKLGSLYALKDQIDVAISNYQSALRWNEVDVEAFVELIDLFKKNGQLEEVKSYTMKCYPYICTRADMARFYRSLGFYYLETYKPDIAQVLYMYSQLFYFTEQAENEICFLEEALKKKRPSYNANEMQQILEEHQIPIEPNGMTLALIYKIAESERMANRNKTARECYQLVYDLTGDEEVADILGQLS